MSGAAVQSLEELVRMNPEDIPTDPETLMRLSGDGEGEGSGDGEAGVVVDGGKGAAAATGAAATGDKTSSETPGSTTGEEERGAVIKTDSGQVIPYGVLKSARRETAEAREAAEAARKQTEEALARVAELEATVKALNSGGKETEGAGGRQDGDVLADLQAAADALGDDSPELAKLMRGTVERLSALTQQIDTLRGHHETNEERQAREARESVNAAIDELPKLAYLRDTGGAAWERAKGFDQVLRSDPENRGLSFKDRFQKVIAAYESAYGAVQLPAEYLSKEELQARADAELRAAGGTKIRSLADLPGGAPPTDQTRTLEAMSPHQIASMMETMDEGQIDAFLAKVG